MEHQPGLPVLHNILQCRQVRYDHGATAAQRFHSDQAEPLLVAIRGDDRWNNGDSGGMVTGGYLFVGSGTEKFDMSVQLQFRNMAFERGPFRAVANDSQSQCGKSARRIWTASIKVSTPFLLDQPANKDKINLFLDASRWNKLFPEIDAHR